VHHVSAGRPWSVRGTGAGEKWRWGNKIEESTGTGGICMYYAIWWKGKMVQKMLLTKLFLAENLAPLLFISYRFMNFTRGAKMCRRAITYR
jgi:hypothetical protein